MQHKVYVLSLAGELLGTFAPDKDPGFGVRAVAWHPAGLFLAVLGWDDKVRRHPLYGTVHTERCVPGVCSREPDLGPHRDV